MKIISVAIMLIGLTIPAFADDAPQTQSLGKYASKVGSADELTAYLNTAIGCNASFDYFARQLVSTIAILSRTKPPEGVTREALETLVELYTDTARAAVNMMVINDTIAQLTIDANADALKLDPQRMKQQFEKASQREADQLLTHPKPLDTIHKEGYLPCVARLKEIQKQQPPLQQQEEPDDQNER